MPQSVPSFAELFGRCERSAIHLELRDGYAIGDEAGDFAAWKAGEQSDEDRANHWHPFLDDVAAAARRGVVFRRLRVVSTPLSEYIRYERAGTPAIIRSGEEVRWLPRPDARDLLLPSNDFWIFDTRVIRWAFFDGDGNVVDRLVEENPNLAEHLTAAFETAWERGIPHDKFGA